MSETYGKHTKSEQILSGEILPWRHKKPRLAPGFRYSA